MVPIIDEEQCNEYDWLNDDVVDGMLCAGYERGQIDSCLGDSGGPLVRKTENSRGRFELIGIVSFSIECAEPKKPGCLCRCILFTWIWIEQIAGEPDFGSFNEFECRDRPPETTLSSELTTPDNGNKGYWRKIKNGFSSCDRIKCHKFLERLLKYNSDRGTSYTIILILHQTPQTWLSMLMLMKINSNFSCNTWVQYIWCQFNWCQKKWCQYK